MSTKITVTLAGGLLALALSVGTFEGCSSSGSSNVQALCEQGCDKITSCFADSGAGIGQTAAQCKQNCTSPDGSATNPQNCTNQAAINSAYQACLNGTCGQFLTCAAALPACQRSGGTGGASGGLGGTSGGLGGSSGGTGGASGGSDAGVSCAICTKLDTCCVAAAPLVGQDAAGCNFASSCAAAPGTVAAQCQTLLQTYGVLPNAPASCK
jgi:hypothetical protein